MKVWAISGFKGVLWRGICVIWCRPLLSLQLW